MRARIATPVLLFVTALLVRLLSWYSVFQQDGVYPNGNDAYYHLRRIRYSLENFPSALDFDPLLNFPAGGQPIWPATMDWLIALFLWPLPGLDEPGRLEAVVVWLPPMVGAATVVALYALGRRFFSARVSLAAALLLSFLPAHVAYSRLGAIDHHVVVALVMVALLGTAMGLVERGEARGRGAGVALGAVMAAAILVWPGSILQVALVQVGLVLRLATASDVREAKSWSLSFAIAHAVAAGLLAPFCLGKDWLLWGAWTPVVLSNFQPLYFAAGAVCFGVPVALWQRGVLAQERGGRRLSLALVGVGVLSSTFLALPELTASIGDAVSWLSKDEAFQAVVNESVPLFEGAEGFARANAFFGYALYGVPILLAWVAWRERARGEVLLLLGWGAALFAATLLQWRFMNSFAIAYVFVIALAGEAVWTWIGARFASPPALRRGLALFAILLLGLVFWPSLRTYTPSVATLTTSLRGERPMPTAPQRRAQLLARAARHLRAHSPAPGEASEGEGYSILGPWGDGHLLKYYADRAVVQDNFGDDVAPENFRRADEYFLAESEGEGLAIVAPLRTRYVLVRASGAGRDRTYRQTSLFARLYERGGSDERRSGFPPVKREAVVPSLSRHRLVYQCEPFEPREKTPYCQVYEIVPGALVVGRAVPGAFVEAQLAIEPIEGGGFLYRTRAQADATGTYRIRLPYSNDGEASPFRGEGSPGEIRVGPRYRLRSGGVVRAFVVPEAAVLAGARVEGPSWDG